MARSRSTATMAATVLDRVVEERQHPGMPRVEANGVELEYEMLGSPSAAVLVLVNGLGGQLIVWRRELIDLLRECGFTVVVFDNRDSGLSTKMTGAPSPDLSALLAGDRSSVTYTLEDMADDLAGLLDALGLQAVHLMGRSMGGMIVQSMAIRHPERVLSLCSIMSTPSTSIGIPAPHVAQAIASEPPHDRAGAIEHSVELSRLVGSPPPLFDEQRARDFAELEYHRSFCPEGTGRQLLAIVASADRTGALGGVTAPALVVHGECDVLVTPDGGRATAKAIAESRLLMIPGMGHDLPPAVWPQLVEAVTANAARAADASGPGAPEIQETAGSSRSER